MFERFTEAARRIVFLARYEAFQAGSSQIEPEHLLLGICREDRQMMQRLLETSVKVDAAVDRLRRQAPRGKQVPASADLPVSKEGRRVLHGAAEAATELKQDEVRPAHLLLGILRVEGCFAAKLLRDSGVSVERLIQEAGGAAAPAEARTAVSGFRDLVAEAGAAKLGPVIGREREMERLLHILSRRTRNSAVLAGEAGVGKTAIVEGLARRMAEGNVPATLLRRRLLAVDATALASPRQRSRPVEEALTEAVEAGDAILFVRGLFNLATAGPAWAVVEVMHALEPHLERGAIQCIATGSPKGLRETFAKAGMLAHHFEVVEVAPVSEEDAIRILSVLKAQFEQFHEVVFGPGAVETAVYASGRFLPERQLPDRAIDLIDEAAAAVKLRRARATAAGNTVTADDIEAAAAARAGVPVEAVKAVLQQKGRRELERIASALVAVMPVESRVWIPFLAAYLARCAPEQAEALARAIAEAKSAGGPE